MRKLSVLIAFLCCFGCVVSQADPPEERQITKVLFFLNGALEHAWAFRHELGRQAVATALEDKVLTSVVTTNEWIPEETISVAERKIEQGYEVIFFTSTGYHDQAFELAGKYPDVLFIQMPATVFEEELPNLIAIDGMLYQASYLAGILAGHASKTNKIGFLSPLGIPNSKAINAFCLGALLANPEVECLSVIMFSFTDPRIHKQGAEQLLELGADNVMAYTGNTIPATMVAELYAQGEEVFSSGFTDDFRAKLGPSVLTSAMFNWGELYVDIVQRHLAGEEIEKRILAGLNNFASVDIAPPSEIVDPEILPLFFSERERVRNAAHGEEVIFCGEDALAGILPEDQPEMGEECLSVLVSMPYLLDYVTPIEGNFYFEDVYLESGSSIYIAMMVIVSLCVALSFVYFVLFVMFTSTPIIQIASPLFCGVIFLGAWMQFAAAYIYLQKPTDAVCMVSIWMEMVGFVMMLSAIVVKNYRLWKLFRTIHKFFPTAIPVFQLLAAIGIGLLGMLIILIAWQASDPYQATRETSDDLDLDEQYLYCGDTNEALWIGLVWGYLCVWICAGIVLAYLTRRLHGYFCETSEISLSLYNVAILELIFLPLIYTMELDQYKARTILLCVQAMYRAIATLSFIFLPKFYVVIFHPEENTTENIHTVRTSRTTPNGTDVDA
mmetsp:Transcript_13712/g.18854  ORF Transcript_13712/g.18854 Transcript_13712/m.18854 type:complete len:668 (+) Transcript_13712:50-2053(+)